MKSFSTLFGLFLVLILTVSCVTDPAQVQVPQELTQKQILQKGQAFMANGEMVQAEAYFNAGKSRFPDDIAYGVETDYNLALLAVRNKEYDKAQTMLLALQAAYQGPSGATLPPQFATLVQNLLKDIASKLSKTTVPSTSTLAE